jgi:hypothetical protein
VLLGKVRSLLIVSALATHGNCRIEVELQVTRRLDKLFKLVDIFELRITVKKKGGVIGGCFSMLMELLQILNQVMNALCIEVLRMLASSYISGQFTCLADNLGWLSGINRSNILDHSTVIISLLVKVITEAAVDKTLLLVIHSRLLRKLDS